MDENEGGRAMVSGLRSWGTMGSWKGITSNIKGELFLKGLEVRGLGDNGGIEGAVVEVSDGVREDTAFEAVIVKERPRLRSSETCGIWGEGSGDDALAKLSVFKVENSSTCNECVFSVISFIA